MEGGYNLSLKIFEKIFQKSVDKCTLMCYNINIRLRLIYKS
jgi:hypothetical protein